MTALETKDILKRFDGVKAVDRLSVSFEEGKITGIVGPNGSGKSTLVNLLTGMIPIDAGEVLISHSTALQRILPYEVSDYKVTRTFQDVRLFEQMPVLDNVLVALTERGIWGSFFERHTHFHMEQAEKVLRRVGLLEKKNELANNLSYGQRKLLEIARVLAMVESHGTNLIFFDEPFAGLFPGMVKLVTEILKELRQAGKTIVLIEHNMEIIRELCDYLFVLNVGSLLSDGKPEDVLRRQNVVEAYLGK